ncbi:glycosyltransferase family 4 protein [Puniceicoccaceae bacterium K14]|nr:glycosyltransferase family 4 protein [Puniceicoccaceae bacterium K14]
MKILYLHQYFNTPSMIGSTRSYEMGKRWVEAGHEVHVITSDKRESEKNDQNWVTTIEDGVNVHWLPVPYSNYMSYSQRIKAFFKFAFSSGKKAIEIGGDVIFATSTPLTIALPAIKAKKKLNIPMVFEVRDLWPEAPIQMGALKSPLSKIVARKLERHAYKNSEHIIALTPGMKNGVVSSGYPSNRVTVIPNASDLNLFSPNIDGSETRKRLGLRDRFTLSYFGTMGPANGLNYVLSAAKELVSKNIEDIVFVLHGDGKQRPELEARAKNEGLTNVVFSNPMPEKTAVAELAAASNVCMTIYDNLPVLYTCSPNKMFDSFAAGRPVLTNMPGWLESLAVDEKTGVFTNPNNPIELAEKAIWMRNNPEELRKFAKNARELAETRFARETLSLQLLDVLTSICNQA